MSVPQSLLSMKRRAEDLVQTIFELGFQNFKNAKDESYILLLSRATGGVDAFFERLDRQWDRSHLEFQSNTCIEWNSYCDKQLADLGMQCTACGVLGMKVCQLCSYKIKLIAIDFERYTRDFSAKLEPDSYTQR